MSPLWTMSIVAPANGGTQGRPPQAWRAWIPSFEAVIQFPTSHLCAPLLVVPAESGNPGISVASPPVHAGGRLWVPACAGTTNCPSAGFPDSLFRGNDGEWQLHQEDALAGSLGVEQAVGFFGLVELPLVGEEAVDVDLAACRG